MRYSILELVLKLLLFFFSLFFFYPCIHIHFPFCFYIYDKRWWLLHPASWISPLACDQITIRLSSILLDFTDGIRSSIYMIHMTVSAYSYCVCLLLFSSCSMIFWGLMDIRFGGQWRVDGELEASICFDIGQVFCFLLVNTIWICEHWWFFLLHFLGNGVK